jgi:hypothetical protein
LHKLARRRTPARRELSPRDHTRDEPQSAWMSALNIPLRRKAKERVVPTADEDAPPWLVARDALEGIGCRGPGKRCVYCERQHLAATRDTLKIGLGLLRVFDVGIGRE